MFVLLNQGMRDALGGAMAFVMNPVIGFGGSFPVLTLLFAGMLTSSISILGRHFFVDWIALAKSQKIMAAFNKERREAMMKQNMAKVKRLNEMSQEIMQDSMKHSMNQMKPMAFTMVIIIIIFAWLSSFIGSFAIDTAFSVPWEYDANLASATLLPHWVMVYALISIPFGQVLQRVLKYIKFKRKLGEMMIYD